MKMDTSKLTTKGQITIPKKIRDALHLKAGDTIAFRLEANGLHLTPHNLKVRDIYGMLQRPGKHKALTVEEMDESVARSFKRRGS